ncbi:MAG TPA: anthranilate phosphoribosyltransferase, partial [Solirubrobacteraceae bacterium]|nr:anthranilate phosphoribosyltransferase [Solirubrobacteraceae bacterium]
LLEALGARIDLDPDGVARCIEQAGFGFMFAPAHHQATRFVVPVRSELAVRTIFNFLGPLTNPAGARRQVVGVSDASFLETIAGALARLGVERALVVAAEDGLDELSIAAATKIVEVDGERLERYTLAPGDVGIEAVAPDVLEHDCAGGTPAQNASVTRAILADQRSGDGAPARLDLALINAGAAIYAGGRADSIADGVEAARAAVADGAAAAALERFVRASHEYAPAVAR